MAIQEAAEQLWQIVASTVALHDVTFSDDGESAMKHWILNALAGMHADVPFHRNLLGKKGMDRETCLNCVRIACRMAQLAIKHNGNIIDKQITNEPFQNGSYFPFC